MCDFVIKLLNKAFKIKGMEISQTNDILVENFEPEFPPLRIAVVTETWPPEVNGVALTLSKLIDQLSQRNHTIQLIRPRQNENDLGSNQSGFSEILLKGLPIPHYPQLKLGLPSKKILVNEWRHKRPDLVHIATEGPLGWSALQAARVLRLPVTSDFRTNFASYSKHYGVGWLSKPITAYLRKFHNRTACTMVPTHALKAQLQSCGFENLSVVSRGVDTLLFHPNQRSTKLRESWNANDETIVLLSVGRLAAEKNLDLIVTTYQSLKQSGRAVKLVIAGDGPYRSTLLAHCPDAIFVGMQSHVQLAELYASTDLFLFPSLTETFGNVTLEALSSGTPVLAYDCAAATELIKNALNGWIVQGEDPQRYVLKALEITLHAKTLAEARQHTHKSVRHWDWHEITNKVEAIFKAAVLSSSKTV
jgi:glycosyltransferase involved in cell wall biosynthesis